MTYTRRMTRYILSVLVPFLMTTCGYGPSSPLASAVFRGDTATAKALLAQGGASEADLQEAVIAASRSGKVELLPELKAHGANLKEGSGVNGWSPLKHAIHKNQLRSVQMLLAAGADPNASTGANGTPLMMAAGYGYTPIVRALLAHGADAKRMDSRGHTALDSALTGTTDIDRFTYGKCQIETVRALLEAVPDLKQRASTSRCAEIQQLLASQIVQK